MSKLLGSFFDNMTDKPADETIAANSIAASAASANAYLNATLTATTPEVRRLFNEYTAQCVMANEAITELAIQNNWISPYDSPEHQLQKSYKDSQLPDDTTY